jgi:mRNA interferase MazF
VSPLPRCVRGELWMVDWSPGRGSEQKGFRPGVILQCDEGNLAPGARTTVLVPLTTQGRPFVFYVPVPRGTATGLKQESWANCTQVLTVDKARLKVRLGLAPAAVLEAIGRAVAENLDLPTG